MENDQLKKMDETLQRVLGVVVNTHKSVMEMNEKISEHDKKCDVLLSNQDWMIGVLTRFGRQRDQQLTIVNK
ncbi:MAG: hypothetical protein AB1352_00850 [Patescibacteria group bacterium]